jgi:hypothetical protein
MRGFMCESKQQTPAAFETVDSHAATCLLMTRFISGHHCPKLAHLIAEQLARLLNQPNLLPENRVLYQNLLQHWQALSLQLMQRRDSKPHAPSLH